MNKSQFKERQRSSGFWAVCKINAAFFNDLVTACVFADIIEQWCMSNEDEWFPLTYDSIATRLHARPNQVETSVKQLKDLEILETKRIGIPSKLFYKVNVELFDNLIDNFLEPVNSSTKPSEVNSLRASEVRNALVKEKETKSKETEEEGKDSSSSVAAELQGGNKVVLLRRKKSIYPCKEAEQVFLHWNNLGDPLASHKENPELKMFQNSMLAIQKELRKHTPEVIMQAMTAYHKTLNNKNTTLFLSKQPGVLVSLPEFFRFSEHTEERMLKGYNPLTIENWFHVARNGAEYLEEMFAKYDKDDNPKITKALITQWKSKVVDAHFKVKEINIFIRSAKLLLEYHQQNKDKINWNSCKPEKLSPTLFAHRVVEACLSGVNGDRQAITPEWLCGPKMYTERMPKYLKKIGMLTSEDVKVYNAPKSKKGVDRSGDIDLSHLLYD